MNSKLSFENNMMHYYTDSPCLPCMHFVENLDNYCQELSIFTSKCMGIVD